MNSRQIGVVRISRDMIAKQPDRVAEAFAMIKLVPVRCELMFETNEFEYTALCEQFSEVPMEIKAPRYELRITQSKAGNVELVEVLPEQP